MRTPLASADALSSHVPVASPLHEEGHIISGSDDCYPGDNPFSKGGRVHYSIGKPFDPNADPKAPSDFVPLTIKASRDHGETFERLTDDLMGRINELLPPEYQFAGEQTVSDQGAERFI